MTEFEGGRSVGEVTKLTILALVSIIIMVHFLFVDEDVLNTPQSCRSLWNGEGCLQTSEEIRPDKLN